MAFQACCHCPHRCLAQRHACVRHFAAELDNRMQPFPRHSLGPLQPRLSIDALGTMPRPCPHPPTALNRIVLAVIGRVIQQLDWLAAGVDTRDQALETWRPYTAACRPVGHCALPPIARAVLRGAAPLPPRCQRSDEAIARLGGTARRSHTGAPCLRRRSHTGDSFPGTPGHDPWLYDPRGWAPHARTRPSSPWLYRPCASV